MQTRETNGQAVKVIRELAGITQKTLADACGVQTPQISRIEAGLRQPSAAVAKAIAERLGVPLDAITSGKVNAA